MTQYYLPYLLQDALLVIFNCLSWNDRLGNMIYLVAVNPFMTEADNFRRRTGFYIISASVMEGLINLPT